MPDTAHHEEEIRSAFRRLHAAIRSKDREELVALHDPEFQGAELPGNLITAEEHVVTAMNGEDLELEVFDLELDLHGDIALAWAKQTLRGSLVADDPGTSPTMAAEVEDGIWFCFLVVWRFTDGRWRMLSYQCAQVEEPELQGGTAFDDTLGEGEGAALRGVAAAAPPATAAPRGAASAEAHVGAALRAYLRAVAASASGELEALYDPRFRGRDLDGRTIGTDEHLADGLAGGLVGVEPDACEVRVYGELALVWGQALPPADTGTTPRSFLGVWVQAEDGWRLLAFQPTELTTTERQA